MKSSILNKLLTITVLLSIVPLALLSFSSIKDTQETGDTAVRNAQAMGLNAVEDSKNALDELAKEAIEVRAVDAANALAGFLYERDSDILAARELKRDESTFREYLSSKNRNVWLKDGVVSRPLYKEIAFIDSNGKEVVKVTVPGYDGKDYALENYKNELSSLRDGQIWVSRLWGELLLKSKAYAGIENPAGQMYQGYYRWVTPVYENGILRGYLSLKLDARHVMEFASHITPTKERLIALGNAPSGNYAYTVDDEGWLIQHPREFHIRGVNPDGTMAVAFKQPNVELKADTQPLKFEYLSVLSTDLSEIHTKRIAGGEKSGSQIYLWAGLTKWIAFAQIPYNTGKNYAGDNYGFGWVAVGAEINKFHEPAQKTESEIQAALAQTAESINQHVNDIKRETGMFVILLLAIVIAASFFFAKSISDPLKKLTESGKKIADGDLSVEMPVIKSNDEVKDLGDTMNLLTGALRYLKTENEKKSSSKALKSAAKAKQAKKPAKAKKKKKQA